MRTEHVTIGKTYTLNARRGYFTVTSCERRKLNPQSKGVLLFSGTLTRIDGSDIVETTEEFATHSFENEAPVGWRESLVEKARKERAKEELSKAFSDRFGFGITVDWHAPTKGIEHLTKIIRRQAKVRFE